MGEDENQWRPIGPYGGSIRGIAIDPTNPDTVYVATFGAGIYRSGDGGDTWMSVSGGIDNTYMTSLAIDPARPQTLYAGTGRTATDNAKMYQTDNGGQTWVPLAGAGGTDVEPQLEWMFNEVTSLKVGPSGLYMGSQAVYRYQDGAWELASEGFLGNGFIHVTLDPTDPNVLYAGTYQGGLYRSDDSGRTWQSIAWETFAGSGNVRVAVDPANTARLLASGRGELLRSKDRGASWSPVLHGDIEVIAFDPVSPGRVWAGTRSGLWVSYDAGESWNSMADFDQVRVHTIAVSPGSADVIFVGTHRRGLFRSRDGGQSWEAVNDGIANTLVSAIAVGTQDARQLYVGTLGDGLFVTTDLGSTWNHVGDLAGASVQTLLVDPTRADSVYVGTWHGLFASHDQGQTWMRAGMPLDGKQVVALAVSPDRLFAGTYGDGLFVSQDGGTSWHSLAVPTPYVTALLVDPSEPAWVYAGTLNGVYRSPDDGATWESISEGLRNLNVRALSAGGQPGWLYAATGDAVYVSRDHGASWDRRSDVLSFDYFRAVDGGNPLLAASWRGVFFSEPGDFRWTEYRAGLLSSQITSLARAGEILFAGTYGSSAYVFLPACRPLYGQVIDRSSGRPVFARIVAEPGSYVTYSDVDGGYAFEYLPPGQYRVSAELQHHRGDSLEVDLSTQSAARQDLTVSSDLPGDSVPVAVIGGPLLPAEGPPPDAAFMRGEILPLTARVFLPEGAPSDIDVVWTSHVDGPLGTTPLGGSGIAHIEVRLDSPGRHDILVDLIADSAVIGHGRITLEVQEPSHLHAIGMAWDGEYLWVTHEPSDTGQIGRIYQLSTQEGRLAVVNSYAHPSPAPDGVAWDGESFWTTGTEGPDPYRGWEDSHFYLYRHSVEGGMSVIRRYPYTEQFPFSGAGLTWDGEHFWGSNDDRITRIDQVGDDLTIAAEYAAPGSQIRTVEWVNGNLWAFDSQSNELFKLSVGETLAVEGLCKPGAADVYGMAWDGTGFWLEDARQPYFEPGSDCPSP